MNDFYNNEEVEMNRSIRRRLKSANRFDNYREISARFDSDGACGHPIKAGDRIGWNKHHGAQCASCWSRWVAENREADAIEQGYMPNVW